ncbi:hypothetical protein ZWY2020_053999 [Hordeum vulgare]|nr:hypothetical protein ZWY2020_053999 [Hordeum vulgare]
MGDLSASLVGSGINNVMGALLNKQQRALGLVTGDGELIDHGGAGGRAGFSELPPPPGAVDARRGPLLHSSVAVAASGHWGSAWLGQLQRDPAHGRHQMSVVMFDCVRVHRA